MLFDFDFSVLRTKNRNCFGTYRIKKRQESIFIIYSQVSAHPTSFSILQALFGVFPKAAHTPVDAESF